jgi:hypothetical protein
MEYDSKTGKRVKDKDKPPARWLHKRYSEYTLEQCLFGLHTVQEATETAVIVESEKTALVAAIYHLNEYPRKVWLASGGAAGLNRERISDLEGIAIELLPDCDKVAEWTNKAEELNATTYASVSLSPLTSDLKAIQEKYEFDVGFDYADCLAWIYGQFHAFEHWLEAGRGI